MRRCVAEERGGRLGSREATETPEFIILDIVLKFKRVLKLEKGRKAKKDKGDRNWLTARE